MVATYSSLSVVWPAHSNSMDHSEYKLGLAAGVGVSLCAVACALLLRVLLHSFLDDRSTFILFTLAVMVSARFGGMLSGAIATGFSLLAGIVVLLGPATEISERRADIVEIALFVFVGLGISWLAEQLRIARVHAEAALTEVRTLKGLLPICAGCKKIRDEEGQWQPLEKYVSLHSNAEFSHGLCDECIQRLYPELQDRVR